MFNQKTYFLDNSQRSTEDNGPADTWHIEKEDGRLILFITPAPNDCEEIRIQFGDNELSCLRDAIDKKIGRKVSAQ